MPPGIPTMITAFGKTQSIADWAKEINVPYQTVHSRFANHYPKIEAEKLLTKEFRAQPKKQKATVDYSVSIWGIAPFRKPCKQAAGYEFEEDEAA